MNRKGDRPRQRAAVAVRGDETAQRPSRGEALVMGGRIALLGIPPGKSPVDWSRIVFKAITIKGVYGREIFETWYKMLAMLENGLDVRGVITHRFRAGEFEAGFAEMRGGASGKVVLDWR